MNNYHVKLMRRALRDLDGIYAYIAHALLEPETARNLVDRIENAILSLETMPLPPPRTETRGLCQSRIPATFCRKLHRCFSHRRDNENGDCGDGPLFPPKRIFEVHCG